MKEEFLFSNTLSATTTAANVKALVGSLSEANELSWQNFKHICTDGAPAMISIRSQFVTLVKNEWPHVTSSHCSLHRYILPLYLMEVMDVAVKVIKFIRLRAKNHRLSQLLAKKLGTQHVGLLFYTKARWLSIGKCLSWLYELKNEVAIFFRETKTTSMFNFTMKSLL